MTDRPIPIPRDDESLLAECRVETFRAGGPGGQHQNKTESAIRLVHVSTGIRVVARSERSQHRNKAEALARLRKKLEDFNKVDKPRRPTRVSTAQKRKRLEEKRRRGEKKRQRRPPGQTEE